jgi:hypothetical protein
LKNDLQFVCGLKRRKRRNKMKKLGKFIPVFFTVFLFTTVISTSSFSEEIKNQPQKAKTKIIAYYFHGTYRCPSCKTIEEWSHDAIKNSFQEELKNGRLVWKALNIEDVQYRHFVKNYSLYTKSLIISEMNGEKEIRWKNLDKVWQLLRNQEKFFSYVKGEIKKYLEN